MSCLTGRFPNGFLIFAFSAFIQPKWIHHVPINGIGSLQGAMRGLMTQNLCAGEEISRCELPHWEDSYSSTSRAGWMSQTVR